ncbi:MAG TPA: hypothetical protein VK802_27815, partial [Streptosporangiaceae bacterium]|nr:hypothetical protein [Streptosporangiaceae bacterium]
VGIDAVDLPGIRSAVLPGADSAVLPGADSAVLPVADGAVLAADDDGGLTGVVGVALPGLADLVQDDSAAGATPASEVAARG